jgi:hypothetical protein
MSLEQRISTTMARAAEGVGAAGFTADEILHKGRTARVRRRARRTAAGVVAVVLAVVATLTATNLPDRTSQIPAGPTSPASPSPTLTGWPIPTSAPQSGTPAQDLGITIANGAEITSPHGRFTMSLPAGTYIIRGVHVVGGWVVTTESALHPQVDSWFQPSNGGAPIRLASERWETDGNRLVVASLTEATMTAYLLPSMVRIAQTRIPTDDNSSIAGVQIVDGVVYADYMHDASPLRTARWDLNTNAVTILAKTVLAWGFGGGSMLRMTGDGDGGTACADIVPTERFAEGGTTGVCSAYLGRAVGTLSPDGKRIVFRAANEPMLLVDAADLHAGVWRPTTITAAKYFIGWDRSSAFLTHDGDPIPKGDGNPSPILRCTGPDTCSPIGLSAGNPLFFVVTDNLG